VSSLVAGDSAAQPLKEPGIATDSVVGRFDVVLDAATSTENSANVSAARSSRNARGRTYCSRRSSVSVENANTSATAMVMRVEIALDDRLDPAPPSQPDHRGGRTCHLRGPSA
jgi:hypothetical protein